MVRCSWPTTIRRFLIRSPTPARTSYRVAVTTAAIAPANGARLRASLGDLLVIAGWIGGLTLVGSAVRLVLPLAAAPAAPPTSMLGVDLAVFAATVAPVGIYLTVTEAGRRQSSWGKRRVGLRVVATDGTRAGPGRIAVRNAVKLLPWQLAHIAVARLILGVDDPITIWTAYPLSLLIPVVSIWLALRDPHRRALHDRIAGTRVVRAAP